jgi:hypothetical protein
MKMLICLLLFSACSLLVGGSDAPKSAKGSRYVVGFKKSGWPPKPDPRSDYVFENRVDGRILLSNSFCDEFQEQPLDQLAAKTFSSVSKFVVKESTYTTFQDREAYRILGSGQVDGVHVTLQLLNTRRNNCYFDFLAISPAGTPRDEAPFEDFLRSVEF